MRRQANGRKIAMEKGLNIAKDEVKRSLRDTAQIINVDKSALSRIGKCLPSNDDVTLEKTLTFMTVQRALGGPSRFWHPFACAYSRQAPLRPLFFLNEKEGRIMSDA